MLKNTFIGLKSIQNMNLTPPKFAIQFKKTFLRIQKCKNNPLITKKCPKMSKNTFRGLKSIQNMKLTPPKFAIQLKKVF